MKCVVNGWVWLPKAEMTARQRDKIRTTLTVTPRKLNDFHRSKPVEPIKMFVEKNGQIGVPRGFFRRTSKQVHEELVDVDDGSKIGPCLSLLSTEGIYAEQGIAVQTMLDYTKAHPWGGFLLQAGCGFGKTNTALEFAYRLGRTTLILIHKEFFLRQWRERIEEFYPGARVGIVRQSKCDFENKDFVIGMMQSIARDEGGKYPPEFYRAFGLVISDECHRIGAQTWSGIVPKFGARWRIGLTATPRRKDKTEQVFLNHLGEVLYSAKTSPVVPKVKTLESDARLIPARVSGRRVAADDLKHVHVLKQLINDGGRNRLLADDIAAGVKAGRKVMVVSERLQHLRDLHALLTPSLLRMNLVAKIDYYIGGKSEKALCEAERANVVLATKQMVEEGLDIQALDVLYLGTPMSDVEQTVGRVRRNCTPSKDKCEHLCPWRAGACEGKPHPIVVDIKDNAIVQARRKRSRRVGFYRGIGVKI